MKWKELLFASVKTWDEHSTWTPIQSNSSMHHYECVALCKDISLQRGRFCARSLASCIPRSSEDRSSWMFFIQVVRGRPGGRLHFSGGRFEDGLASICVLIHSCKIPKESETTGLNDGWKWWLVGNATESAFLTKSCSECPVFYVGILGLQPGADLRSGHLCSGRRCPCHIVSVNNYVAYLLRYFQLSAGAGWLVIGSAYPLIKGGG